MMFNRRTYLYAMGLIIRGVHLYFNFNKCHTYKGVSTTVYTRQQNHINYVHEHVISRLE